jgi:hypothetical protein
MYGGMKVDQAKKYKKFGSGKYPLKEAGTIPKTLVPNSGPISL